MSILKSTKAIARNSLIAGIVAIVLIAAVAGGYLYSQQPTTPTATTTAPAAPKNLMVYTALAEFETARILAGFTQDTGIQAKFLRLSAGEMAARIIAEAASPKGDVFLGGPAISHMTVKAAGLLVQYKSPSAAGIPDQAKDPDGYWTGFYVGGVALAVNTDLLKKMNLTEPKSWADLLKPQYKGQVVMANVATSGTAMNTIAGWLSPDLFGEPKTWDYVKALNVNIHHYERAGAVPAQLAGSGQFLIGIAMGHDVNKIVAAGYPIDVVYPSEGTGWEIGALSIIKGGPNPDSAKTFADWMLGPKGGQIHTDISLRVSTRTDVMLPPGATPIDKIKLVKIDFKWMADNTDRIVKQWQQITGA
jgi:iron(III) transport system substrate-binding protein